MASVSIQALACGRTFTYRENMPPRMAFKQERAGPTHALLPPCDRCAEHVVEIPHEEPKRKDRSTCGERAPDDCAQTLREARA